MTRLTGEQTADWLGKHGFRDEPTGHHVWPGWESCHLLDFKQPEGAIQQAVLAREMAAVASGQCMLYVQEVNVWPTTESWPLITHALAGYGDPRSLHEAPGMLFEEGERDDLQGFIRWALMCSWTAYCLSTKGDFGFALTDDEWCAMFARTRADAHRWIDETKLNLRVLGEWEGP